MTITQSSTRFAALTLGVAVVVAVAFAAISVAPAHAASICPGTTWSKSLQVGSSNSDVLALQKFLNSDPDTMIASTGAGSPGSETSYFGGLTRAAVIKFQTKYGISAIGLVGPLTRAKLNSLCAGGVVVTPGPTPTPAGTGLTVTAAAQPANSLAPNGVSRLPFTSFTLTAGNDGDVTITGVTVQRTGFAADAAFSGVELVDQANGVQIGTSKTLNSNHQATIGDTIVIPRGTSRTFTVAANRGTTTTYAGQIASFSVVSINTSAVVTGSLPIVGASNTINESLSIGSISTSTSAFDPGAAQTKSIGDTNIRFSGLRFTANSSEDVKLFSVRWRQVGSIGSSDLANVITVVNGVSYPTTVDSSGKYYTSVFPNGVLITKGNSIDAYVQGDLIGSNSASRTVDFDIDKVTDVYFVGQLYGFGIAPAGTYTPWFNGYVFNVNGGTATTIGNAASEVPSNNVAVNVSNQILGGFITDFKGEAVSENSLVVRFSYSTGAASTNLLTSVSLVSENGAVVAGPIDGVAVAGTQQSVTFTDTVTFPIGRHVWTIKGKVPSTVASNVTVTASTTPSGWGSPTGQTSGNTVSLSSNGAFSMNVMTVKAATLSVTVSATPASQVIIPGTSGALFANVQLNASQSGEDVRLSTLPIRLTLGGSGGAVGDLTSCQLFNGTTAVNTGSNVPTNASSGTATTFTLDNSLTIPRGTIVTLALRCNVSSGAATTATYTWSVNSGDTFTATGSSGASVTVAVTTGNSGTMSAGSASLAVALDPSSPGYVIAAAGSTGVTLGAYKFTATNDNITLNRIGLSLGSVTASSSSSDLTQVYLYNGATLVGTATFAGADRSATSTLSTAVTVPANGSVTITVKGDLAAQGFSQASHPGALLTVDVDTNGAAGSKNTQGTGTGTKVDATGSTAVSGVRVFRTYPTVTKLSPASLTLIAQSGVELYRFSVTANAAQDLALNQFDVNIATSSFSAANGTTTVDNVKVFAYTDAALSTSVPGAYTSAQVVAAITPVNGGNNTATLSPILVIPKGVTYYFKVTGTVAQVAGTTATKGSITTKIMGDAAYPLLATTLLDTVSAIGTNNFVWSPMSTSTSAATTNMDWTNGFNVQGLPSAGTDGVTLSN